jgi:hypothetical protein
MHQEQRQILEDKIFAAEISRMLAGREAGFIFGSDYQLQYDARQVAVYRRNQIEADF